MPSYPLSRISSVNWLIFDVDGVLMDASMSYDLATKYTVENVLRDFGRDIKLDLEILRNLRKRGSFGDDYKLSEALILSFMDDDPIRLIEDFPNGGKVDWFRDRVKVELDVAYIKDLFDTYYFGEIYEKRLFDFDGLWKNEKSLVDVELLRKISKFKKLGVVTGRTVFELKLAFEIMGYEFENFITREKGLKPDPHLLDEIVKGENGVYVGDTVNDEIFIENYRKKYGRDFEFVMVGRDFKDVNELLILLLDELTRGDER
ncbi:MAG: HAD-IA family hydrolase [Thermotogae bacterium]|nr:HAD-IA family hydrolase [Thermotogota bacterium]